MTQSPTGQPCELCGFDASLYGLDTDLSSTVALLGAVVAQAADGLSDDQLHLPADVEGETTTIANVVASVDSYSGADLDVAHHGLHAVAQIGVLRTALGAGPPAGTGKVTGLHRSDGGVPKTAAESVEITSSGVVGDRQNDRIHHGRPLQALCVFSADTMEALNAEGHPIVPGQIGENIMVDGIDWASLQPGSRITVGDIPVLMTAYAVPCSKIAEGFTDRHFNRVLHTKFPGWSRLYGVPLAEGTVSVGDEVSVG